jgi:hypothetical protein
VLNTVKDRRHRYRLNLVTALHNKEKGVAGINLMGINSHPYRKINYYDHRCNKTAYHSFTTKKTDERWNKNLF